MLVKLPYRLRAASPRRVTLALVVLQKDESLEDDFRQLVPERDVSLHATRIPSDPQVNEATLTAMAHELPRAAAMLPAAPCFDVIGYGCTSASTLIGSDRVSSLIKSAVMARHVTNPLTAALEAFNALGMQRIGYLSPYIESVSMPMIAAFEAAGFAVPRQASFMEESEERVARIDPQSIAEAARELGRSADVDAVFLSCTNLKTLDILEDVEHEIRKPVVSSNLALAWHMRSLAGLMPFHGAPGRLFDLGSA